MNYPRAKIPTCVALLLVLYWIPAGLWAAGSGSEKALAQARALSALHPPTKKLRLIVGIRAPEPASGKKPMDEIFRELDDESIRTLRRFRHIPYMVVEAEAGKLDQLARTQGVTSLQADEPDRPFLNQSAALVGASQAWNLGYDGSGQVIAVLDTGIDSDHSWFGGGEKVVAEACFSSNAQDAESLCPDAVTQSTEADAAGGCDPSIPYCWHGTHVAGIAAGNRGTGNSFGIARGTRVLPVQVFSLISDAGTCDGAPPCVRSYPSDQVAAMEHIYELRNDFDFAAVNLSLGGGSYSDQASCDAEQTARKAAIDLLLTAGISTVAASGNGSSRNGMAAPACISSAISVGATDDNDNVASFSNMADFVDLLAPGVGINSAMPGGGSLPKSGTSMATPHVAGALAVLKQKAPGSTPAERQQALVDTGLLLDDQRGGGSVMDIPRIQLDQALAEFNDLDVELELSPLADSVIDLGTVLINQVGNAAAIMVSNTGTDSLTLACELQGADVSSFRISGCSGPVAPGPGAQVQAWCVPLRDGPLQVTLKLFTNDLDESPAIYALQCEGDDDIIFRNGME